MTPPGEPIEVDYRIRPAKHAERSLISELIARLDRIKAVTEFRYVGMGSVYFVDFALVHRKFGIVDMISIEQRDDIIERCEFNAPYDCITVLAKSVGSALPELRSSQPTIMWLDYTGPTTAGRLEEIKVACTDLALPSLFLVTTDVSTLRGPGGSVGEGDAKDGGRLATFRKHFGDRDAARITHDSDINQKKYPSLMYGYIDGAIRDAVESRPDSAKYKQLVHIRYADGAEMLTVGGLIYSGDEVDDGDFDSLEFFKEGEEPYELRVPRLTHRERSLLDQLLPAGNLAEAPGWLDHGTIEKYARLYRHAPFFVDVQI